MSINNKSFEHTSANGVKFHGERCDFTKGITVVIPPNLSERELMQDAAEFSAWHRCVIWERLNGFSGYDHLPFQFVYLDIDSE